MKYQCYACGNTDIEVDGIWKICKCGIVWVDDAYFKANAQFWKTLKRKFGVA